MKVGSRLSLDPCKTKDTSGELNFLTPISGKDITREFTAGIKERCMLPVINCQAVTSVLDPVTGHISTVLTTTATSQHPPCPSTQPLLGGGDTSPTAPASNKKPSYLNLACCVNGYSNLTTYDSKLRQDINKSREVSPSRPIIATLHYNRTDSAGGGHLLTAPTLSYVSMNNTINNNYSGTIGSGTNRMFKMNGSAGTNGAGGGRMRGLNGPVSPSMGAVADVTDNAGVNGFFNGNGSFLGGGGTTMRSKVISSQSQISSLTRDDSQLLATPKKSFIQQRVEKLYGASEGVVINKQYYSSSERKYLNNIANENHGNGAPANGAPMATTGKTGGQSMTNGNGATGSLAKNGVGNGHHPYAYSTNEWNSLITVLRHLRPEFRAQLQIFSPKKVPKASPNRTIQAAAVAMNGNNILPNGTSATADNVAHRHSTIPVINGNNRHSEVIEREEEHQLSNGSTNRTTTKSARTSSHITTNANGATISSSSSSSNGHYAVITEESSSIIRHHSNTSTRTVKSNNVIEQQEEQHQTSTDDGRCYSGSILTPDVAAVEEKLRSLVVVPPPAAERCVSSQQQTASAIATVVVPDTAETDVLKPATVASVIENGQQNGVVDSSSSSDVDRTGLEIVGEVVEAVHCDNSTATEQAVTTNSMRTSNGGDTTLVVGVGTTITMAGIDRHQPHQLPVEAEVDNRSTKSTVEEVLAPVSATIIEATVTNSTESSSNNNNVLDGNYFLQILKTERHRLQAMADEVEKEISQLQGNGVVIGEDLNGYILVAVGKARLLCSQKMKQFEDLCYTNLNQSPDEKFQTTGEDLRGFWDMVMLQVNNVDATFVEIDSFRKNGWRKPIPKSPPQARNGAPRTTKLVKRPYKTQTNGGGGTTVTDGTANGGAVEAKKASAALAAAKREAQRKQLMEMKRKQKLANSQPQQAVEIFAPSAQEEGQQAQLNGDSNTQRTAVDTS